jgi:MYXO-CTERM domain-containing protein
VVQNGNALCRPANCAGIVCGTGRICADGRCIDSPCTGVRCAPGERCEVEVDVAVCVADWLEPDAGPEPPSADAGVDSGVPLDASASNEAGPIGGNAFGAGDVGVAPPTNGAAADAGAEPQASEVAEGCACNVGASRSGSGFFALLLMVGAATRRRRGARKPVDLPGPTV